MPEALPVDEPAAAAVFFSFKLDGFFPEFSAELCAKVFPRSGVALFAPGERLLEQGAGGRDLYLVLAGRVAVRRGPDGAQAELARLGAGEVLGEIALLNDGVRTASAVAVEPTRAFRLAYEDMGYVLQHNPALAAHLRAIAERRTRA